jgi:hypothetical protein
MKCSKVCKRALTCVCMRTRYICTYIRAEKVLYIMAQILTNFNDDSRRLSFLSMYQTSWLDYTQAPAMPARK